ncbi:cytochrome P450 [Xylariaceae sp. FL1272]|nr:cytochrome P450 [Xylariaceae sp. FL1272]
MSARVFLGAPACRNTDWLNVSINYSMDAFTTAFILRMFPWLHLFVAYLIPSRWRMKAQLQTAMRIIEPIMKRHAETQGEGERKSIEGPEHETLMQWMLENGTEEEKSLPEMAARQCVLTLASIHTTATDVTNTIFELCSHPEWIPVLREELEHVVSEFGLPGTSAETGMRLWRTRFEKLDRVLVETLRHYPPIIRKFRSTSCQFSFVVNG